MSKMATNPINNWMKEVTVIEPSGNIHQGEYDGYGRVGPPVVRNNLRAAEAYEINPDESCHHTICWEHAGKPGYSGRSESARDQGYFFDDEHDVLEPELKATTLSHNPRDEDITLVGITAVNDDGEYMGIEEPGGFPHYIFFHQYHKRILYCGTGDTFRRHPAGYSVSDIKTASRLRKLIARCKDL